MEEGYEKLEGSERTERDEIFSKSVRAGKRTYFFDVKATKNNDFYLTITESKKRFNKDGRYYFEKHKIFLYKEDFEKFTDGLAEVIGYIKTEHPEIMERTENFGKDDKDDKDEILNEFASVEFEDLEESVSK
jgi:hypothetical protein